MTHVLALLLSKMLSVRSGSSGYLGLNLFVQIIDESVDFQGIYYNLILVFHVLDLVDELSMQQDRHTVVDNLSPISRFMVSEMYPSLHRYIYQCMDGD